MGISIPSCGAFLKSKRTKCPAWWLAKTMACVPPGDVVSVCMVTPVKWTEAGEWGGRHLISPTCSVSVVWLRLLDAALRGQDLPGDCFPCSCAAPLPVPVVLLLQVLPSPCSSCFVLSHQEASRTALPSSLKFLTHGNQDPRETGRGTTFGSHTVFNKCGVGGV